MSSQNPKMVSDSQEKSEKKTESIRAFEFLYFTLKLQGMVIMENYPLRQKIHVVTNYILVNICYYSTFTIQLFYVNDLKEFLGNFPMNLCVTACCIKFSVILKLRRSFIEVNKKLEHLDSRPMTEAQKDELNKEINFCRFTSKILIVLYLVVNLMYALTGALSHGTRLGFETWFPYDWRKSALRFWISLSIQSSFQILLSMQNVANDFLVPWYLSVVSAHLQIVMDRFAIIHHDPEKTEAESFQDFIQCLADHRSIMDIFEIIQNTLSFTIFFQFITSILAFSTLGVIYFRFSPPLAETVAVFILMLTVITEILPSCYYSDKFMEKTDQMDFMIYSSNWTDLSPKFRKHLIIFMQMTQKKKVILAGKQIPITLATFMSVMKAMYTMLMILNPTD